MLACLLVAYVGIALAEVAQLWPMSARALRHASAALRKMVGSVAVASLVGLSIPFWPAHVSFVIVAFGVSNAFLAGLGFECARRAFEESDARRADSSASADLQTLGARSVVLGSMALAMVFLTGFVRWGMNDQFQDLAGDASFPSVGARRLAE